MAGGLRLLGAVVILCIIALDAVDEHHNVHNLDTGEVEQLTIVKTGEVVGSDELGDTDSENADASEGSLYPGPFSPPMPPDGGLISIGTAGYTRTFNVYGGTPADCGGSLEFGTMETYAPSAVTDLSECVTLCNACTDCVGFVDEIKGMVCVFMQNLDYGQVKLTSPLAIMAKYYNAVKSYTACDAGFTSAEEETEDCTICSTGKSSTKGSECQTCASGKYSDHDGASTCLACPPGKVTTSGKDGCVACPVAKFSPGQRDACIDCSAGYYNGQDSASVCSACDGGKSAVAISHQCEDCATGEWASPGSLPRHFTPCPPRPDLCRPGSLTDSLPLPGSETCTACTAGKKSLPDNTDCEQCPSGTRSGLRSPVCLSCTAGQWSLAESSTCTRCQLGFGQPLQGQDSCTECVRGYFAANLGSTACLACTAGQYSIPGQA